MTERDRAMFAELMIGIGETYGEPVSDARLEIYFRALEDIPLDAIRVAANLHVRTQKFFPRPAELREAIDGHEGDAAELAWGALLRNVKRIGYYGTPEYPDEAAKEAALAVFGSWGRLCSTSTEDAGYVGLLKQFKSTYAASARRDRRDLALPSREEARARLSDLKGLLQKRGLPAPGL